MDQFVILKNATIGVTSYAVAAAACFSFNAKTAPPALCTHESL